MADYTLTANRATFTLDVSPSIPIGQHLPTTYTLAGRAAILFFPMRQMAFGALTLAGRAATFLWAGARWHRHRKTTQPFHRSWS